MVCKGDSPPQISLFSWGWWLWDTILRTSFSYTDFSTLGGQIRYVPLTFFIKHTCTPAVISLCLAIPWQQIAYHRKLEWRLYLVWISLLHCLIPHSIFHSRSASFFFLQKYTMTEYRNKQMNRCCFSGLTLYTFQKHFDQHPPPPAFYLWAECISYSVKIQWLDGRICIMCSPYLVYC